MITSADCVIIGAGSAGSLLAAGLSADPARQVLLIEAGEEPTDPDIWNPSAWPALQGRPFDWDYRTVPQRGTADRVHRWARGKVVGGSSVLHAMGWMRGHPTDYDAWVEATGDAGWGWESLQHAFRAIEDHSLGGDGIHGTSGKMPVYIPTTDVSPLTEAFMDAGVALGLPRLAGHNSGQMIGVTPNSLNIRNGLRVTAADAWLTGSVRARPNLTIWHGSRVIRLIVDGARVSMLEVIRNGSRAQIHAAQVILCAGAIESPALLMRSGIGPAEVLHSAGVDCLIDMQGVGRNLQDHLLGAGNIYAARRPVPPSKLQHSESMAYMRVNNFSAGGQPQIVVGCGVAPIASDSLSAPEAGAAYTLLFGVTHPTSRGELCITGPEIDDPLMIDPSYLQTESDRRMFRAALSASREIGHHSALAGWRDTELLPGGTMTDADVDAFIAGAAITHHHPAGTCRMGNSPDAVVTPDLKLASLDNLYVVDASVMPNLTAGPIHAPVLAIAQAFLFRHLRGL